MRLPWECPAFTAILPLLDPMGDGDEAGGLPTIARTAEDLGYDFIKYPRACRDARDPRRGNGGTSATCPYGHYLHRRGHLAYRGLLVCDCAANQNPIVPAKAVVILDVMSGGRVRLTFRVGDAEHEFEILGVFH